MCPVQSWVLTSQLVAITCPDSRFYGQVKEQLVNRSRHERSRFAADACACAVLAAEVLI